MSEHTPGPWTQKLIGESASRDGHVWVYSGDDEGGRMVARISGYDDEQIIANARLIAAAPELLEALKGLRDVNGVNYLECPFVLDGTPCGNCGICSAGKVLAKAEGRLSECLKNHPETHCGHHR